MILGGYLDIGKSVTKIFVEVYFTFFNRLNLKELRMSLRKEGILKFSKRVSDLLFSYRGLRKSRNEVF
jgi:acyl CoA:acetate/3-ketoacid CoA transferase